MKTIAVLSGKGGTGKSSITASLAITLAKNKKMICADCDVDASNLALVLGVTESDYTEWLNLSTIQKAEFDYDKCNNSQKCISNCYFQAIESKNNKPQLKDFSCEGCGVCEMICPSGAIKLIDVNNAKIGYTQTKYGFKVVSAQLKIGESGSGRVVAELKNKARQLAGDADIMLIDSAAGIACPVIASVSGCDYGILVVEPTPAGFFDLQKAYEIINHFNIPTGMIINKYDLDPTYCRQCEKFAQDKSIKILGKINYDQAFIKALVNMLPVVKTSERQQKLFIEIASKLEQALALL